ncbi:hypothetical protein HDV57DRAFT_461352 [Trichoderma longibrachiatum]
MAGKKMPMGNFAVLSRWQAERYRRVKSSPGADAIPRILTRPNDRVTPLYVDLATICTTASMTTMSHTRTKSLRYLLILSTTWCNQPLKPTYHPPWYLPVYLTPLCLQLMSTCSTRPSCVRDIENMSLQDRNNDVLRKYPVTRLSQILPYHSNACMGSSC